jgi:HD superfamily phosphohydrolase
MNQILRIPEIQAFETRRSLIRIPDEMDVPVTDRVRTLIDTAAFRRLSRISQLGLVSLIYPAANHSRFEHSLGVYRNALLYLKQLAHDSRFAAAVDENAAKVLIVSALLHDIGHWPFCHPIEDMRLAGVPRHEAFAEQFLFDDELRNCLRDDWQIESEQVVALLNKRRETTCDKLLCSILSGPVDIDKMDYLFRDSLHAGVPYGKNFDQQRLMGSLCLNQAGDSIALTEKGKTAAEMMVFSRYVMFSEVYWHHAVRSATAMLQRAFYLLRENLDLPALFRCTEEPMMNQLLQAARGTSAEMLLEGLFGPKRSLYKRLAQFSSMENPELFQQIARQPFDWLCRCGELFAERLAVQIGQPVQPHEVLFDAPPVKLEVEFNVEIYLSKRRNYQRLSDLSPVVQTLAMKQFDDYVKRVRIFIHPRLKSATREAIDVESLIQQVVRHMESAEV